MDDFIHVQDKMAQIEMFFVHNFQGRKRVFALLRPLAASALAFDPILNLPLRAFEDGVEIVGLPRLGWGKIFMLPVKADQDATGRVVGWELAKDDANGVIECTWEVRYA